MKRVSVLKGREAVGDEPRLRKTKVEHRNRTGGGEAMGGGWGGGVIANQLHPAHTTPCPVTRQF